MSGFAKISVAALLVTLGLTVASASAAIIALYDANGSDGNGNFNNNSFDSADIEPLTDALRLSQGGGLTGGTPGTWINSNGLDAGTDGETTGPRFNFGGWTDENKNSDFAFSFKLQSNGNLVRYERLSYFSNQYASTDPIANVDIGYTVNGGSEVLIDTGYKPYEDNGTVGRKREIDFSDFQTAQDVTWTFYLYDVDPDTSGGLDPAVRFDDIILEGTIIPEPSSLALLACGLLGLIGLRRRKR